MTFIYITIFLLVMYVGLIVIFTIGWRKIPIFQSQSIQKENIKITIVIASKNEEKNLPQLFHALNNQTYTDFELIVVNDHSTDRTLEISASQLASFHNIKVLSALESGKKNALALGIQSATGELIITTDADCIPGTEWVETIVNFYLHSNADLIICPVKMIESDSLFSKLQALEFISLIASGAGAAGTGMPIMCNGANLAFKKTSWLESKNDLHVSEPSGDDIFLLLSIKKRNGKIRFLKSQKAIVNTKPASSLKEFFNQRGRWARKSKFYSDWQILFVGFVVSAISLLQIFSIILSLFQIRFLLYYFIILAIKFLVDFLFLNYTNSFFKLRNTIINYIIISISYPLYISIVFLKSFACKATLWR